jgi:hypothetical protein
VLLFFCFNYREQIVNERLFPFRIVSSQFNTLYKIWYVVIVLKLFENLLWWREFTFVLSKELLLKQPLLLDSGILFWFISILGQPSLLHSISSSVVEWIIVNGINTIIFRGVWIYTHNRLVGLLSDSRYYHSHWLVIWIITLCRWLHGLLSHLRGLCWVFSLLSSSIHSWPDWIIRLTFYGCLIRGIFESTTESPAPLRIKLVHHQEWRSIVAATSHTRSTAIA